MEVQYTVHIIYLILLTFIKYIASVNLSSCVFCSESSQCLNKKFSRIYIFFQLALHESSALIYEYANMFDNNERLWEIKQMCYFIIKPPQTKFCG